MSNFLKILGILSLCAILIFPLAGCDKAPWDGAMTLVLKIDEPKDGATVSEPTVKVSGRLSGSESSGVKVKVNDAEAPVKEGAFSLAVPLTEGENVINVVAQAGQAILTEKVKVVYSPAR